MKAGDAFLGTFLGSWELIPALCIYEQGGPPQSGIYTIAETADGLSITITWVDSAGEPHDIGFDAPPDGTRQETDTPGLTHMTLTRIDAHTLDSAAFNDDVEVMYARRRAEGDLLTTWQRIQTPAGPTSIFQVYRRRED